MTISSPVAKATHLTNAAVTEYTYPFKIFAASQVSATVVDKTTKAETVLTVTTDYTVAGVGAETGGKVVLTAAGKTKAGTGHKLVLLRNMGFTQEVDYQPHDIFPAETHERALDILTMQDQELREMLGRAIVAPLGQDPVTWNDLVELRDETKGSADRAEASETAAKTSETAAKNSETAAKTQATAAGASAAAAAHSATQAATSATAAATAVTDARALAGQAAAAASQAQVQAGLARAAADEVEDTQHLLDGIDPRLTTAELAANNALAYIWIMAINAVRLTGGALRRSMEIYKLGGY